MLRAVEMLQSFAKFGTSVAAERDRGLINVDVARLEGTTEHVLDDDDALPPDEISNLRSHNRAT